jgi:chromosome segregation ATPase
MNLNQEIARVAAAIAAGKARVRELDDGIDNNVKCRDESNAQINQLISSLSNERALTMTMLNADRDQLQHLEAQRKNEERDAMRRIDLTTFCMLAAKMGKTYNSNRIVITIDERTGEAHPVFS